MYKLVKYMQFITFENWPCLYGRGGREKNQAYKLMTEKKECKTFFQKKTVNG